MENEKTITVMTDRKTGLVDVMTKDTDHLDTAFILVKGLIVTLLVKNPKELARGIAHDMINKAVDSIINDTPTGVINLDGRKRND